MGNLNLSQVASNQQQKEITINDATDKLDLALTDTVDVNLASGNVTMTAGDVRENIRARAINNAVARDLTLPAIKRLLVVQNDGSATLSVKVGSGTVTIVASAARLVYTDGSANGIVAITPDIAGAGTQPYDIGAQLSGAPTASLVMLRFKFPRAVSFPSGLTSSQGTAGTAATAQTDFDIRKNGASVGTMRFAAAGTAASFIMASAQSFAASDLLTLIAPASPDATLADIAFVLAGTR